MTPSNLQDAQLSQLSDDYIRNLEPESQRYDITLAQDFVISVLPNGIKTWAFIYDFQGRHRRKTLGVFPEMNFEDARQALEKARASMQRMDEPTVAPNEFGQMPAVLGGGRYVPKTEREPFNWKRLFMVVGVLAALGAIGWVGTLIARSWNPFAAQPESAETASQPGKPSLPFTLDTEMTPNPDTPTSSGSDSGLPFKVKPKPAPAPESSTTKTGTETIAAPANVAATGTEQLSRPATTSTPPASRASTASSGASTRATGSQSSAGGSTATPAASKPVTTLASTTKATAFGGRVSRSRLTSRVQDLEPTDTLGPEISYKNSGFTRVFYFTELREFSDGTVVHRWLLDDVVQEEVVLKVSKSWRWRTYSNKDLTPGLNGQWKVETIDATGKVLDTEEFTYDYR